MAEKIGKGNPPKEHQWKPGQSGNPKGLPKGTKHLSTWIQELLNDEKFEFIILNSKDKKITYKGAPMAGIIGVAIHKAMKGDVKWGDWLAKHGYGTKINLNTEDPVEEVLRRFGLVDDDDDEGATNAKQAKGAKSKTSS